LRVIKDGGEQLGVMSRDKALALAKEQGLDLILVAEKANPPVAKIIDFSKFKYQQSKKTKSGTTKTKATNVKEVRFTPFMAENDFNTRLERAREFLADGHKVKLVVKFTGRQITRKEFGISQMDKAVQSLSDISKLEQDPKWLGKLYVGQIKPTKQIKKDEQDQN